MIHSSCTITARGELHNWKGLQFNLASRSNEKIVKLKLARIFIFFCDPVYKCNDTIKKKMKKEIDFPNFDRISHCKI